MAEWNSGAAAVKVLVVDDHPLFREMISGMLRMRAMPSLRQPMASGRWRWRPRSSRS